MSDTFEINNRKSGARQIFDALMTRAENRIAEHPEALPFKQEDGRLVLNWLRGLADRKPSEF